MDRVRAFHRQSLVEPERFWAGEAERIYWHAPFTQVLDYSRPPFAKWFVGGETNLCHNAVDRHLADRGDQPALIWISTEVNAERTYTYRELHAQVQSVAAMMTALGVGRGDRVIIYMPNTPEAVFAILACARIGAVHSVVFGGFAAASLAARIDDAKPALLVTSDGGSRMGKPILYKPLVDESIALSTFPPKHVLIFRRGLDPDMPVAPGRDVDWATLATAHAGAEVPCAWLESSEPSYILYTSGTTGRPKGVQRDVGGHAVAMAASMAYVYCGEPGETIFTTSDVGWAVGHSYIIYGPLLVGMTSILYEGVPIRPDPGVWWRIVQEHRANVMFSAPTAIRVLKKSDASWLRKYDLSSLKHLFLAGEPLDAPTHAWISEGIGKPVIDHYWQTETGWPVLSAMRGIEDTPIKFGSPSFPTYGFDLKLLRETDLEEARAGEKAMVVIEPPLPPGCLTTLWRDDARFVETYFSTVPNRLLYNTFDWGLRDGDGYYFILGRTDDVINVAGHRLGTREIEEAVNMHPAVAECAVVGVADELKGQLPMAFAVVKDPLRVETPEGRLALEHEILKTVDHELGAIGRPSRVLFVPLLPKTRSGKVLRRSIAALAEGRNAGDLTTIEDPAALEPIRRALAARP